MPHPTILLIDFDASSIDHATSSLTQAGYHVEVARDGVSGLEAFERLKPDLVLVEAILPKKHGFQVCQEIKSTPYGKCTPILVTSSEALGTKYLQDALQLYGCDEYVEKPVSDAELVGYCQRLLPEVVVTPQVAIELPRPSGDSQRLDDLSEDELMQRLDQLIDRATLEAGEPTRRPSGERDPSDDGTDRRPLGEVDLVAFCERVFPHSEDEDAPRQGEQAESPAPRGRSEKTAARLLNEEEVVGQLDALARKDPRGGLLPRPASPASIDLSTASPAALVDLQPPTPRRTGWSEERRSKLVWRTGLSGAVLVAIGLILLAVGRGRMPVEPREKPDLALAGPLSTPPAPVAADGPSDGASIRWDTTPVELAPAKPSRETSRRASPPPRRPEAQEAQAESTAKPVAPASEDEGQVAEIVAEKAAATVPEPLPATDPETALLPSLFDRESPLVEFSLEPDLLPGSTLEPASNATDATPSTPDPRSRVAPEPVPAPRQPARNEVVPLDAVDRLPVPLEQPLPEYDAVSRRMHRQGTVVIEALIDETGAVTDVRLVEWIPRSTLNEAALDAVRHWRYRPAQKDGKPVRVRQTIRLEFKP